MIVEDDSISALVMSQYLEAHGYETIVARNGLEGVSAFAEEKPDVAFVDCALPRKNGFEACLEMKHSEHGRHTPVVLMSAVYRNTQAASERASSVAAEGFLRKPFDLDVMVEWVRELVDQR
jgi:CheY-like chemotaxis protein